VTTTISPADSCATCWPRACDARRGACRRAPSDFRLHTVADRRSFLELHDGGHELISVEPWTVSLVCVIGKPEILLFAHVVDSGDVVVERHELDGLPYPTTRDALLAAWNAGLLAFRVPW